MHPLTPPGVGRGRPRPPETACRREEGRLHYRRLRAAAAVSVSIDSFVLQRRGRARAVIAGDRARAARFDDALRGRRRAGARRGAPDAGRDGAGGLIVV